MLRFLLGFGEIYQFRQLQLGERYGRHFMHDWRVAHASAMLGPRSIYLANPNSVEAGQYLSRIPHASPFLTPIIPNLVRNLFSRWPGWASAHPQSKLLEDYDQQTATSIELGSYLLSFLKSLTTYFIRSDVGIRLRYLFA